MNYLLNVDEFNLKLKIEKNGGLFLKLDFSKSDQFKSKLKKRLALEIALSNDDPLKGDFEEFREICGEYFIDSILTFVNLKIGDTVLVNNIYRNILEQYIIISVVKNPESKVIGFEVKKGIILPNISIYRPSKETDILYFIRPLDDDNLNNQIVQFFKEARNHNHTTIKNSSDEKKKLSLEVSNKEETK
ncbi:MAG: hypothetical protein ACLFPS_09165 [Clostridia bacterium]